MTFEVLPHTIIFKMSFKIISRRVQPSKAKMLHSYIMFYDFKLTNIALTIIQSINQSKCSGLYRSLVLYPSQQINTLISYKCQWKKMLRLSSKEECDSYVDFQCR